MQGDERVRAFEPRPASAPIHYHPREREAYESRPESAPNRHQPRERNRSREREEMQRRSSDNGGRQRGVTKNASGEVLHDAPLVNSWISKSKGMSELMKIVMKNRQSFDFICASAAVSKAAKMIDKRSQSDVNNFMELVEIARGYLPVMEPRNVGNFLYSLAKAGQFKEDLIREALREANPRLKSFNIQGLTNIIWALATLNYSPGIPFIRQLLKVAESRLEEYTPQNFTNTVWAMATLKYSNGSVFITQLLKVAETKLRDFDPQNVANMLWSLAALNFFEGSFIRQLLKEAEHKLSDFKPQHTSNTVWALATLKYADGSSFIKKLLREVEPKLSDFNPQNLTNTLWALATLNYRDGSHFVKQLLREIQQKMEILDHQNLSNTAWALAVLDHADAPSFLTRFLPLAYEMAAKMRDQEKYQCLQYIRLMEDGGHVTDGIKSDARFSKLKKICQEAKMHETTSRKQSEVLNAIRRVPGCSDTTYEHLTEDGLFTVDIALQLNGGQKLAIEVDGPSHFLSDERSFNGGTVLRNRLLENRGWKVISIPLVDWYPLREDDQKEVYLANKLKPYM